MPSESDLDLGETVRAMAPGQRVFHRFTLTRILGRGGMGVVWLAHDEKLQLDVALKFLPEAVGADEAAVADLARETRHARELAHPHIVRVYDFHHEEALAGISMEWVDGSTLSGLRLRQPHRVFEPPQLSGWLAQLAEALDYAHRRAKVVHRDLKPANLMVSAGGELKIADFGTSASVSESITRVSRTASSSGSPPYMSPQQMRGEPPHPADDIYALGATLYELLTGKPPFFSGNIFMQAQEKVPPPIAERRREFGIEGAPISSAWEATIAACLEKKVEERPRSAGEVAARLNHVSSDAASGARDDASDAVTVVAPRAAPTPAPDEKKPPATPQSPPARSLDAAAKSLPPAVAKPAPTKRGRRPWAWAAVIALAVAGVGASWWWLIRTPDTGSRATPVVQAPPESVNENTTAAQPGKLEVQAPATPREFVVTVDPPDVAAILWLGPHSDVEVKNGRAVLRDLPDDEYELIVTAPGYQPVTTRVRVKDGAGTIAVPLVPVRGALAVTARPGTVVTAVDERGRETRLGAVPAGGTLTNDNMLTVGPYTLRLENPDSAPVSIADIELTVGRTVPVAAAQVPLPGELRVFSVPDGAEVRVGGVVAGRTPATLRNQPSEQALQVEVFLRGYQRATQEVTLKPKEVRTVNFHTLVAEAGAVELRLAGFAGDTSDLQFRIDGREAGRELNSPPSPAGALDGGISRPYRFDGLEIGVRTLEIAHPDYEPWKQTVTVRDHEVAPIEAVLKPKPATLALAISGPAGYELLVDGELVAVRDGRANIPAGREVKLALRSRGWGTATRAFTPRPNSTETWKVVLEKLTGPKAGQSWTVPDLGLEMVWIKPGEFTMGSPASEEGRRPDEGPQTRVRLTQGFWMGKYEVSQGEWYELMEGTSPPDPMMGLGGPMMAESGLRAAKFQISWDDAMAFCRKLTERERAAGRLPADLAYTLPTEAQWEYACRADTTGPYAGDLDAMAWYAQNTSSLTFEVGQKQPNAWGLHDMHGNAWEWCADWYSGSLPGGAVVDPKGPFSGSKRVNRGGSLYDPPASCRAAFRGRDRSNFTGMPSLFGFRIIFVGFRLALTPVQ